MAKPEEESKGPYEKEFTLSDSTQRAFGDYAKTIETARKATEVANEIELFIQLVNMGLMPRGFMVMTVTQHNSALSMIEDAWRRREAESVGAPEHGTIVYRPNPENEHWYIPDGELVTWGSSRAFLGDRFDYTKEGDLVLINSELSVGVSVFDRVEMVSKARYEQAFLDETMPYINDASGGAKISADLGRL